MFSNISDYKDLEIFTNLGINTNECICSVVELFFQWNDYTLEAIFGFLFYVCSNLPKLQKWVEEF